jgi:hypothetical protein
MPGAMPANHARTLRESSGLSPTGRWIAASLAGAVVIAIALVVVLTNSSAPRRGCINVTLPSITGAITLDQCGQAARATCASGGAGGLYHTRVGAHDALAVACRRAGLPLSPS